MYAFCTPSLAKVKYCQLEKEALAIIFGIKGFHRKVIAVNIGARRTCSNTCSYQNTKMVYVVIYV
jgi:hypothetical protein